LLDNRPNLQTMKHMNEQGTSFDYQNLGDVSSVEVGDTFDFRYEMFVVELHPQVQEVIVIISITARDHHVACDLITLIFDPCDNSLNLTMQSNYKHLTSEIKRVRTSTLGTFSRF